MGKKETQPLLPSAQHGLAACLGLLAWPCGRPSYSLRACVARAASRWPASPAAAQCAPSPSVQPIAAPVDQRSPSPTALGLAISLGSHPS
jgi:hypothetical protein